MRDCCIQGWCLAGLCCGVPAEVDPADFTPRRSPLMGDLGRWWADDDRLDDDQADLSPRLSLLMGDLGWLWADDDRLDDDPADLSPRRSPLLGDLGWWCGTLWCYRVGCPSLDVDARLGSLPCRSRGLSLSAAVFTFTYLVQ